MEYTLWALQQASGKWRRQGGLNPYSNGIYSMSLTGIDVGHDADGLNPYSNGIYSMRLMKF